MIPLRAATPNTVKNPTSDPIEITPPVANAASTPPTRADGRVKKARVARRQEPKAACRRRRTPMAAAMPKRSRFCWAACRSWYSPSSSAWYSSGNLIAERRCWTSLTTAPRSRPLTLRPTSMRRELFSRAMRFGVGRTLTLATSPRCTVPPLGVLMSRLRILLRLSRAPGVPHTITSYTFPSR